MQKNGVVNKLVHTESEIPTPAVDVSVPFTDSAFEPLVNINLKTGKHVLGDRTTNYLAHSVARNPGCLLTHVQRIILHVKRKESDGVQGALLDLFIVLGTQGTQLRKRMLKLAKPLLDQKTSEFFITNFTRTITATDVLPVSAHSVLTKAVSGTTELVKEIAEDIQIQDRDPLQEAHECLEFGLVDEAQRILEEAILEQPTRAEIHHDLLEIYKYTVDKENFNTIRARLESINNPFAQLWENMVASFEGADNQ